MAKDAKPITHPSEDRGLTAEVRALMGVFALNTRVEAVIEEIDLEDGLSDPARHLIIQLGTPQRMGDLARRSNCLPSSVTAIAKTLEVKGLARRERDPEDGRAMILYLTDDGEDMREALLARASDIFKNICKLTDAQTQRFAELNDIIRTNIFEASTQESPS